MPQRGHVHPDLVGAAGVDFYLQKREFTVCTLDLLCDFVVRDGISATVSSRGHTGPFDPVAAHRRIDGAGIGLRPALYQRYVFLFHLTSGELIAQIAVSGV